MSEEEIRLEGLTIYLAKPDLISPDSVLKEHGKLISFPVEDDTGPLGILYVEKRHSTPPRWGRLFAPQVPITALGLSSSTSAVFHALIDGRSILLTFGQGRHLLKPACWEERFGLRVVLNSIKEDSVRSIDKQALDAVGRHTRVQASKEATPSEFGLDIERDLLQAVTGTPNDQSLGNTLSGLDSLHANVRTNIFSLRTLLSRYLSQSESSSYKKTFPWVDHISDVKDPMERDRLDTLALEVVAGGKSDKCWLAVPEAIEWNRVVGFRYGSGRKYPTHHDIDLSTFFQDVGKTLKDVDIDLLKNRSVEALNTEGNEEYAWSVYKCLYCEVELNKETYLLTSGRWYKVSSNFVAEVNSAFSALPLYATTLPEYDDDREGSYNKRVAANNPGAYALMDEKFIYIGGGNSKVEFCDLFGRNRDVVHVKRYGGPAALSHLFTQGIVSGESFMQDATFRQKVNSKLPKGFKLVDVQGRPDATSYQIVFAIVKEGKKPLTLPFFSRLSLRNAAQRLGGYGYRVSLAKISVNEIRAKIAKHAAAPKSSK